MQMDCINTQFSLPSDLFVKTTAVWQNHGFFSGVFKIV